MNPLNKIPVWFLLFLTAYAVRLAYVLEIADMPYFSAPAVDAEYHDSWAMNIAGGDFTFEEGPFFRAPFYPFFLGAVYAVFGHDYFLIRILQALLGSLTCVLIYLLGSKLFNKRIGLIAGYAAAFTGIIIYFDAELLLPVLLLPLYLSFILLWFKAVETESLKYWFFAGLLLGISAITRPNILIILPLVIITAFSFKQVKSSLIRSVFTALGILLPILPVTVHNVMQGEFVPIATQGGVNFYIGNNARSDGAAAVFPGLGNMWRYEDTVAKAEMETGRELKENEVSNFYYGKGLQFIVTQPGKWLKLMTVKFLHFINTVEISNNKNIYFSAQDSVLLTILLRNGFWLYGSLGIMGFILFYKRSARHRLIIWFVLLYMFSILMFFVTARYRLPLIPIFIIFAAAAVDWTIVKIREKQYADLKLPAIAWIILLLLIASNVLGVVKMSEAHAHFSLGIAYSKKGRNELALQEYLKALKANPQYPQVNLNMGVLYYDTGDYDKAEELFRREIEINKGLEKAYALNNLGNIRVRQGLVEESIPYYKASLQIYPIYQDGKINLAQSYHDAAVLKVSQDSLNRAGELFKGAVDLFPENEMYRYNYGLILGELGREQEAVEEMRTIIRRNPDFQPAQRILDAYEKMQKENR